MKTYDLRYGDRLNSTNTGFTIEGLDESWVCVDIQVPLLVAALRDLGHITDPEPELLSWYTVERHGPAGPGPLHLFWTSRDAVPFVSPGGGTPLTTTRYLPLSALRGHTELPGWDDVAPAPEPELPAPWLAVSDEDESVVDFVAAYAWACDNERIVLEQAAPSQSESSVVAWCPIPAGQPVPPHPYARAEQ